MAKGHTYFWRRPGRREEERKRFADLMRKVEAVRIRHGMTKAQLAAELGANVDGVRAWITGRTVGRRETVAYARGIPEEEPVTSFAPVRPQTHRVPKVTKIVYWIACFWAMASKIFLTSQ